MERDAVKLRFSEIAVTFTSSAAGSSLLGFLSAQSRNFSRNRAVSLCSDRRPNRAQLGLPSPCLLTHNYKTKSEDRKSPFLFLGELESTIRLYQMLPLGGSIVVA